jgi:hypothetical protein
MATEMKTWGSCSAHFIIMYGDTAKNFFGDSITFEGNWNIGYWIGFIVRKNAS